MAPTKSVKLSVPVHEVLANHARKTGKKIQFLLERAVMRYYGGGAEKA